MKKVGEFFERFTNVAVITCMIVVVLSEVIRHGLQPVGNIFFVTYLVALAVLAVLLTIRIFGNIKALSKDRLQFLVTNVICFVVLIVMTIGLLFNYYGNVNAATIVNYVALALYMFTGLCLL